MSHGGCGKVEDRVLRSVVPSFAKPAKLGQP
jgi:hypothetical protein